MALTQSFNEAVKARVERDPAFRGALLTEAVDQFLASDLDTGKVVLRDCIKATIGAEETGSSSKSLLRMVSPTASNLSNVLHTAQQVTACT